MGARLLEEQGVHQAAIVGPETQTCCAPVPQDASFVGIQFAVGTSLRAANTFTLLDRGIPLPDVTSQTFHLDGHRWQTPGADDAEFLVERLVPHGVLDRDPLVSKVLRGEQPKLSQRSIERRFRAATGLTRGAVAQIERVRMAAGMLVAGTPVSEVVDALGYYDEPHLARMLRRYVGRSAQQLASGAGGAIALDPAQCSTT